MVRRGGGVRIAAALARTYYIGVEADHVRSKALQSLETQPTDSESLPREAGPRAMAICLLPAGTEEGQSVELAEQTFQLLIRQPVEFPLYVSSTRLTDATGSLVAVDPEQIVSLPPIRTVLQAGKKSAPAETVSVKLHARLTEIGTLELWCSEAGGSCTWRLQFDVRSATQTDVAAHEGAGEAAGVVDEATVETCRQIVRQTFLPAKPTGPTPEGIVKRLEQAADMRRAAWPPTFLRSLWDVLMEAEAGRRRTPEHEARWLYLLGFALRPGYGMAVDDWRVAQTWRLLGGRLIHAAPTCRVEWQILWRRIAGGLAAGQQKALAEPLLTSLPALFSTASRKGAGSGSHELAEGIRFLGACELLPAETKIGVGQTLVERASREKNQALQQAEVWAIGRIGARVPMYGPLNTVPMPEVAEAWIDTLLERASEADALPFALMQLARRTEDRYRDVSENSRSRVCRWLSDSGAPAHYLALVREGGQLEAEEQGLMFGESLPRGLQLV
jgi:hypothetical protein